MCQPVELGRFELRPCRCTSHCATAREIWQRHRRGKFSGKSVRIPGNPVNFHLQGRGLAVIDLIGEPYMLVMSALTSSKPLASKIGTSQRHRRHLSPAMLYPSATTLLALTAYFRLVSSQLIVPQVQPQQGFREENLEQIPIELDFGWHNPEMEGLQPNGPPLLSDILGIDRSLSIFAGLGRSIESIVLSLIAFIPNISGIKISR
jgi:hypothetical protein